MNGTPRRFDTRPPPRSRWGERAVLLLGGALLFAAAWMWNEAMEEPVAVPGGYAAAPEPGPPGTVVVEVRAVLELPTETPLPTATAAVARPTATPVGDYCAAAPRYPDEVCRVPPPPPPTSTPYPPCGTDAAAPNQFCRWTGPAPAPTNQPPREDL